jgi:hypothetical protein
MERFIGSLSGVTGHTFDIVYDMLVSTDRVVLALVQHPADTPLRPGMGELIFGRMLAGAHHEARQVAAAEQRRKEYAEMQLDDILAADSRNLELLYADIQRARVRKGLLSASVTFHLHPGNRPFRTLSLGLRKDQVAEARHLLGQGLPASKLEDG